MLGKRRVACKVLGGNLRERDHLESLGLDGRLFKWIFKKQNEVVISIKTGTCGRILYTP
jgi:hypothetical protein